MHCLNVACFWLFRHCLWLAYYAPPIRLYRRTTVAYYTHTGRRCRFPAHSEAVNGTSARNMQFEEERNEISGRMTTTRQASDLSRKASSHAAFCHARRPTNRFSPHPRLIVAIDFQLPAGNRNYLRTSDLERSWRHVLAQQPPLWGSAMTFRRVFHTWTAIVGKPTWARQDERHTLH